MKLKKEIKLATELEDLWDWICVQVGFDKEGKEIQKAIRKFVEMKLKNKLK